jgi:hypothetical protein
LNEEFDDNDIEEIGGDRPVYVRVVLVIMLSVVLLGTLHWAMSVTNANARQISSNLTSIEKHIDDGSEVPAANASSPGPQIDTQAASGR